MIGTVRKIVAFAVLLVALAALFAVAVNTGTLKVGPTQLLHGLFVEYDDSVATVFDLRFPRIFIAMAGGAALAASGALLQAVIRNPLADPGIIGISSGAGFAAVAVTLFAPALFYFTPLIACAGGFAAFALVYALSWRGGSLSPLRIVLVGIAVSAMFSGLSAAASTGSGGALSGAAALVDANITMKTWGDLRVLLAYAAPLLVAALVVWKRCDLLLLEDKTARSLGVDVAGSRLGISAIAVVLASIATAVIGPISFLGLIVPHCARLLVGSGHKWLVPYSMLLGAFALLLADTIGRSVAAPYEIGAAVVMSVIGGPAFIVLLRKAGSAYGE
ncbi:ABC transporter permease [Berryella intestinalis]|uniref:Probable heme-iron transport system permease protein IsdF n=1 Tax=Berryella intestinalis TaxID=1531429 RepID=A0A0A8B564_9ACTN|nr:iron ABC transporter permease [Berryella intestinalis]AJC12489.1 ABC transporter permease [Berryella intestinalis]